MRTDPTLRLSMALGKFRLRRGASRLEARRILDLPGDVRQECWREALASPEKRTFWRAEF
jgi:hypothetical protein